MTGIRRLAPPQSRRVNALVRRECCNYDCGNCILLDNGDECACPQTISFSLLCKWFRIAVQLKMPEKWYRLSGSLLMV